MPLYVRIGECRSPPADKPDLTLSALIGPVVFVPTRTHCGTAGTACQPCQPIASGMAIEPCESRI